MLKIEINQAYLEVDPNLFKNFRELVVHLERDLLEPKGEVITALFLNGVELEEQDEKDQNNLPVDRVKSLKLRTSNKEELALQALQDAVKILPEIQAVLKSSLTHFENNSESKGMADFVTVTDGLNWFSSVYHGTEVVFRERIKIRQINSMPFLESSRRLSKLVQELVLAQQRSDLTTFRDILEYELGPLLKEILDGLPEFLQALSE